MFGLMRVKTHNRLIQDAVDRALRTGYSLGEQLPHVKVRVGTDIAMREIEDILIKKIAEDWHEQNDDRGGAYD